MREFLGLLAVALILLVASAVAAVWVAAAAGEK